MKKRKFKKTIKINKAILIQLRIEIDYRWKPKLINVAILHYNSMFYIPHHTFKFSKQKIKLYKKYFLYIFKGIIE